MITALGQKEKYHEGRLWMKEKRNKYSKDVLCASSRKIEESSCCHEDRLDKTEKK
jgi:hypothetical protein